MAGLFSWLGGNQNSTPADEIPCLFPLSIVEQDFVRSDIFQTYSKILTDTMERVHGLPEALEPMLWDSCVQSEASQGVISLLADAMTAMSDLFLVYNASVKVVRKANGAEAQEIRVGYGKKSEPVTLSGGAGIGIFISFKNYKRTELLRIYSVFEHCVLASLNKSMNVSKSVQFKINELRTSVSLVDADIAKNQAKSMAEAMRRGNDILMDAKDVVGNAAPDTSATEKAMLFIDNKRASILGLPMAYVTGEQTGGMGSSGEQDMRAVERGLKNYYESILRPTLKALFGAETEFQSQDFREINSALEVLKTFDLISSDYISPEARRGIVARIFDLDEEEELKLIEEAQAEEEKQAQAEAEQRRKDMEALAGKQGVQNQPPQKTPFAVAGK